jgi:hypothetical protein
MLTDPVRALALIGFEGLDGVTGLLHRASHKAADGVSLPSHFVHNLGQGGAALTGAATVRCISLTTFISVSTNRTFSMVGSPRTGWLRDSRSSNRRVRFLLIIILVSDRLRLG